MSRNSAAFRVAQGTGSRLRSCTEKSSDDPLEVLARFLGARRRCVVDRRLERERVPVPRVRARVPDLRTPRRCDADSESGEVAGGASRSSAGSASSWRGREAPGASSQRAASRRAVRSPASAAGRSRVSSAPAVSSASSASRSARRAGSRRRARTVAASVRSARAPAAPAPASPRSVAFARRRGIELPQPSP